MGSRKDVVQGEFMETTFSSRYQRNNKKNSLKNLRCFPSCGFRHKERGFCGRSVLFKVESPQESTGAKQKLLCFAEFLSCGQEGTFFPTNDSCESLDISLNSIISLDDALSRSRTRTEPTLPWLVGDLMPEKSSNGTFVFEFNKQRRGWHYGWQSNKHTCDTQHCFRVYVFEAMSSVEAGMKTGEATTEKSWLKCSCIVDSSRFMLFCRRRRRFYMSPSAPSSQPVKKLKAEFQRPNGSLVKMDRLLKDLVSAMKAVKTRKANAIIQGNERDLMLDDLARYLLRDNDFKKAMDDFLLSQTSGSVFTSPFSDSPRVSSNEEESTGDKADDTKNESYVDFLRVVETHLHTYRRTRNISLSEFEIFFKTSTQTLAPVIPIVKSEFPVIQSPAAFDHVAELVANNFHQPRRLVDIPQLRSPTAFDVPSTGSHRSNVSHVSGVSSILDSELDGLLTDADFHFANAERFEGPQVDYNYGPFANASFRGTPAVNNQRMFSDLTRIDRYLDTNFEDDVPFPFLSTRDNIESQHRPQ